ncbi:hypothetical protein [Motilibacter deserti]|uniref:Dolichyl-phosphate-mannose-protein mannosyltransferase n=1 Tax=Motilibacter deserti TaxID=2714956 RepID=A0ABX0GWB5_9ACTN|nr:hypothetical protein [Motilibacter deserti]NHC14391.1 hypothetical protein [Motilibacter deserti]
MQQVMVDERRREGDHAVTRHGASRRARWAAVVGSALAAAVLGLCFLTTGVQSPFDEMAHFDYVAKLAEGDVPQVGEDLGQESLREFACRSEPTTPLGAACGATSVDPALAPFEGQSYTTEYFPTFYGVTAVVSKALGAVPGVSLLEAARLADLLWLCLGVAAVAALSLRLGARPTGAFAGATLLAAMPLVLLLGTSVTNDSAAIGWAALVLLVWLRLEAAPARRRVLLVGLIGLMGLTVKETTVPGLALAALLELRASMATGATSSPGGHGRPAAGRLRALVRPLALLALPALGYGVLAVLDDGARGVADPANKTYAFLISLATPQGEVLRDAVAAGLTPFAAPDDLPGVAAAVLAVTGVLALAFGVLSAGSAAHVVLRSTLPWRADTLTVVRQGFLVGALVTGPVFLVATRVTAGVAFYNPRYALPLAAVGAAAVFADLSRRWSAAVAGAALVVVGVLALGYLVA